MPQPDIPNIENESPKIAGDHSEALSLVFKTPCHHPLIPASSAQKPVELLFTTRIIMQSAIRSFRTASRGAVAQNVSPSFEECCERVWGVSWSRFAKRFS